jgi:hypothetical protein
MNALITALLLLFGVPQAATPTQNGKIEGKVVRASNNEVISGVQITLIPPANATAQQAPGTLVPAPAAQGAIQVTRTPDGQIIQTGPGGAPPQLPTTVTDADGKYSFNNLVPGQYTVRALRDGYFGPMGPQGLYPNVVTKAVAVEADKTQTVDFGLVQGGTFRGLVRDPDGQPAPNYAVVTARPAYTNLGRAIWSLTGARNADDRGEYRWPGFAPGEYYIGVGPRAPGPIANVQDSWARVFYPGVINPNQARSVTIPEGGEVTVDLAAQVRPWNVYKISGIALNPVPNLPVDTVTGVVNRAPSAVILMPIDLTPLDNPPVTMWTNLVATNAKPNGEFVLSNVDPGRYELYAMAQDIQNRRIWAGHLRVEVKDKDITGLNIPISPGVTLKGEVVVAGGGTLKPEDLRMQLQALDTLPPQIAQAVGTFSVDANGKFEIANLAEGRYRMNGSTRDPNGYFVSITQGGVNVFDEGFAVDTQSVQLPLRIEINPTGPAVEGDVKTAQGKPAANAVVALVPAAAHRNNPTLYRLGTADGNGHFNIRGVAPGAYTAYSFETVLPGAYQNEDFLSKYQGRGRPVNVTTTSRNEVQLEMIPTR